jgi:hypothetical protein
MSETEKIPLSVTRCGENQKIRKELGGFRGGRQHERHLINR